jgi:hypothetical protein
MQFRQSPTSLRQDYKERWVWTWLVMGEKFETASARQMQFVENQPMFLDRFGYVEETFFTFSFSPILVESGRVGGRYTPLVSPSAAMNCQLSYAATVARWNRATIMYPPRHSCKTAKCKAPSI